MVGDAIAQLVERGDTNSYGTQIVGKSKKKNTLFKRTTLHIFAFKLVSLRTVYM